MVHRNSRSEASNTKEPVLTEPPERYQIERQKSIYVDFRWTPQQPSCVNGLSPGAVRQKFRRPIQMNNFRILIADDYEVVRCGIRSLLQRHEGWEVCGEASDGRDAVTKAAQLQPDVVVLDIGMPNLNGVEAARQILQNHPSTMILVLTLDESEQAMQDALQAGARAYVLKSDTGRDLVAALEALQNHRTFFTAKLEEMVLNGYVGRRKPVERWNFANPLTHREREVVQLLAEGRSTRETAAALGLSVKTAETHRSNIMRKLGLHSVTELVLFAVRNNIVRVNPPANATALGEENWEQVQ